MLHSQLLLKGKRKRGIWLVSKRRHDTLLFCFPGFPCFFRADLISFYYHNTEKTKMIVCCCMWNFSWLSAALCLSLTYSSCLFFCRSVAILHFMLHTSRLSRSWRHILGTHNYLNAVSCRVIVGKSEKRRGVFLQGQP